MSYNPEVYNATTLIASVFDKVKRDRCGIAHVQVKLSARNLRRDRIKDADAGECVGRTALERSWTGYRLALESEVVRVIESRFAKNGQDIDLYQLLFAWHSKAPGLRMKINVIAAVHDRADAILRIEDLEGCRSIIYFHLAIVKSNSAAKE